MKYKRILIKLSGETLSGENEKGINEVYLKRTVNEIKKVYDLGCEIAIVIGGGNFWRGKSNLNMERVDSDSIGMLGTLMNSIALKSALVELGIETILMSTINVSEIGENFDTFKARKYLKENKVLIFGAGIGHPYFSTDMAASLRAIEIKADIIIKATKVDGVYNKDPKLYSDVIRYSEISFDEIIKQNLEVFDITAIILCKKERMPLAILNFYEDNALINYVKGMGNGTSIK